MSLRRERQEPPQGRHWERGGGASQKREFPTAFTLYFPYVPKAERQELLWLGPARETCRQNLSRAALWPGMESVNPVQAAGLHACCLEAYVLPRSMRVASKHACCLEACALPRSMRVASKHACCLEACVLPRSMTVVRRVDVHACGVVPSVPADDHVVRRSERADSDAHTSQTYHSKVGMWGDAVTKERTFRVRADLSVETLKC